MLESSEDTDFHESITIGLPDPHEIDRVVGCQIKARRLQLGVSQVLLATRLGLSFQQLQKYEWGANRVSSSKLFMIAFHLQVSPNYFFEPLSKHMRKPKENMDSASWGTVRADESSCNINRLAEITSAMPSTIRTDVIRLLETIAGIHLNDSGKGG